MVKVILIKQHYFNYENQQTKVRTSQAYNESVEVKRTE